MKSNVLIFESKQALLSLYLRRFVYVLVFYDVG